uniref:Uncharacterized protein n=1 Tax=Acrobeloides nanus TaxID=290746 RepID=A0A914CJ13_9BILA
MDANSTLLIGKQDEKSKKFLVRVPKIDKQIIFNNPVDHSVQQPSIDGTGIIIINKVSPQVIRQLEGIFKGSVDKPATYDQIQRILQATTSIDRYHSNIGYVSKNLKQADPAHPNLYLKGVPCLGVQVACKGAGTFDGPTLQHFNNVAAILSCGTSVHLIQAQELHDTYLKSDGSPVSVNNLKAFQISKKCEGAIGA